MMRFVGRTTFVIPLFVIAWIQIAQAYAPVAGDIGADDLIAQALDESIPIERREAVIQRLAGRADATSWVCLFLMDGQGLLRAAQPSEIPPHRVNKLRELEKQETRLVTALIAGLPAAPPREVLYALTYRLDDTSIVQWSDPVEDEEGNVTFVTRMSDPIRELARKKLAAAVDDDFRYEPKPWRRAILDRAE